MLHQVIVSVDKNEKGKIITSNIAADVMGNKNKALKNLISGINNAKSILYIRNEIKDGPSGYSRPPSGARGSTLNTQLHPSGNLIIEDSRRVGKDVAGGEGRGKCIPPLVAGATTFPPRWEACHTILRSLCSLTNRVPLPPHPGDRTTCA